MNRFTRSVALAGALVLATAPALMPVVAYAQAVAVVAQPATDTAVVTVPYGTWLTSGAAGIQEIVVSIVMAVIAFACRKLPAAIGTVLKSILTQQLVERAIAFGMNTVTGAAKDKVLSVPVGNAVLANALNYVLEHAPAWFVKWTGGEAAIRDHIIALLPVAPDASLANATPTATDPVAANG